jgi:predicted dehydrogenase
MAQRKLRVGVIGTGFGTSVQIPAFLYCDETEAIAVCSARRERADAAAAQFKLPRAFTDYHEMLALDDLDAVSIVTPPYLHHEMALAALAAGKHVICEKPFAVTVAEAEDMYEAAQRSGLTAMVAHEFRFSPQRAYAAYLLQDGYVGEVRQVDVSVYMGGRGGGPRPWSWQAEKSRGGGMLGGLGSHYIDGLRAWLGEIDSLRGHLRVLSPERVDSETGSTRLSETDDTFGFTARFASGAWATMSASTAFVAGPGAQISIYGSEGTLVLRQGRDPNPPTNANVFGARRGETEVQEMPVPDRFRPFVVEGDNRLTPFVMLIREFVRGIEEHRSPAPSFYDGLRNQQVQEAVSQSSQAGDWIRIPPVEMPASAG